MSQSNKNLKRWNLATSIVFVTWLFLGALKYLQIDTFVNFYAIVSIGMVLQVASSLKQKWYLEAIFSAYVLFIIVSIFI